MKKMIARTALVASLALAAVSLSACGSTNDCASAVSSDTTVTATSAMFPAKGGGGGHGGGHSSGHAASEGGHSTTSEGSHVTSNGGGSSWFAMPHWFGGGSHTECKSNPAPTKNS